MKIYIFFIVPFFLIADLVHARDYYCDPVNGNISNDGSIEAPWPKLEDVFNAGKVFQPGDVIYLLDGYHGNVSVKGINSGFVIIKNYKNASPELSSLSFGESGQASNWVADGLIIGAEYNSVYHKKDLVYVAGNSSYIRVKNCKIFTKDDISNWTVNDWNDKVSNGVIFDGTFCTIEHSEIKNIRTGIQFGGSDNTAFKNTIMNFAGDGMRGLADNGVFEYNLVQDNYVIDGNHDDGFQSWTDDGGIGKGTVRNIVLRGNIIINYTDSSRNFIGPLQGIFGTDGMFENFVIENNVVIVDHWHGISLYGAKNCKIINNTVVDTYFGITYPGSSDPLGPSWIRIADHKDGTQSSNNIIRNNISNKIILDAPYIGVSDHNLIVDGNGSGDYENLFIDWSKNDMHLKQNSQAIDKGTADEAPGLDADANFRPQGLFDTGAYEYGTPDSGETGNNIWQSFYAEPFSKNFTVEFDLKPGGDYIDAVTGILSGEANDYPDLSCIVRLNPNGTVDAYDQDHYTSDVNLKYTKGDEFHVKMDIDPVTQTYDVQVTKNKGSEAVLAKNYRFRKHMNQLDSWAIKSETGYQSVNNVVFYSGQLGIDIIDLKKEAVIYPTFNKDGKFFIKPEFVLHQKLQISLYDLNARKIDETVLLEGNSNYFEFKKYKNLKSGIYYILLTSHETTKAVKIIKKER